MVAGGDRRALVDPARTYLQYGECPLGTESSPSPKRDHIEYRELPISS